MKWRFNALIFHNSVLKQGDSLTYKNIQCLNNLPYCKENWQALSELQLRVLQLLSPLCNFLCALLAYVNCMPLLSLEHVSPAALNHQKAALPVHL